MKKIFKLIIAVICVVGFFSCNGQMREKYPKVASNPSWTIYEINDSTFLCVPVNSSDDVKILTY